MLSNLSSLLIGNAVLVTIGVFASAIAPMLTSAPSIAQESTSFPDVPSTYWAQPFIQRLAAQKIIAGYPDGTFRPEKPLERDEFAALIRVAFNQEQIRQIPSGSVFKDIPTGYWAASAVEQAYETGFMKGYPGGFFRPTQEVTRVQALVSLVNGLNLSPTAGAVSTQTNIPAQTATQTNIPAQTATQTNSPAQTATQTNSPAQTATQTNIGRANRKPFSIPLSIISLMQPVAMAAKSVDKIPPNSTTSPATAPPTTPNSTTSSVATAPSTTSNSTTSSVATAPSTTSKPPSFVISNYYQDAKQIPYYAIDEVAAATKANIVVNYPNIKVLNPNQPIKRAVAAALIYQTMVYQGKLPPINDNLAAHNYIVTTDNKSVSQAN